MTLAGSAALVAHADFRPRVVVAITAAAINVAGEAVTPGEEAKAAKRAALAHRVLQNPPAAVEAFVWAVAANPTISVNGIEAPDGDIEFVVASVWDDVAGVGPADTVPVG